MSADVILMPKKLRAEWMDAMAMDAKLSHIAFRAAGVIGSYFNKHTGAAYPSQRTIAKAMGVSARAAWGAIKELETEGYLIVGRRALGEGVRVTKTGSKAIRFAGGKGTANTYVPAFERSQLSATTSGTKLAARCDHYWNQWSQNPASKVAAPRDPTLVPPSEVTLQGENPLGKAGEVLSKRLGPDVFASWFAALDLAEVGDDLRLVAPGRFKADYIRSHYQEHVDAAFGRKVEIGHVRQSRQA